MGKKTSPSNKTERPADNRPRKVEQQVTIQNKLGLHARAAASVAKTAFHYESEIELVKGRQKANAKSIMGILTLAAAEGTKLKIIATGGDAEDAIAAIKKLFDDKFGEN